MANPYSAVFRDDNSDTRLAGSIDFTDAANQPGGIGATQHGDYSGNAVTIADASFGYLTWDSLDVGVGLLDTTTPNAPTIITAGVYAFTVGAYTPVMTVGGWFAMDVVLGPDGVDTGRIFTAPFTASAVGLGSRTNASITYYMPAGATIRVEIDNTDGAASRDFALVAGVVQRLA